MELVNNLLQQKQQLNEKISEGNFNSHNNWVLYSHRFYIFEIKNLS